MNVDVTYVGMRGVHEQVLELVEALVDARAPLLLHYRFVRLK